MTSATGLQPSRLFYISDRSSGHRFLVDTGAEVSVVPPLRSERKHAHCEEHCLLQAVNNTPIKTYGKRSLALDLGLRRNFRWLFIVADVKHPILGADFLRNCSLLVDVKHGRLSDGLTNLKVQGIISHEVSPRPLLTPISPKSKFERIVTEFPRVTQPCIAWQEQPVKHTVTHHIEVKGPPMHARTRRLAPKRLKIARQEFEHMAELGIVRPSSSSWSSPLHMVPKATFTMCR